MRLLVVEDNAQLSQLLAKGLGIAGYETDLLATAAEARAALLTTTYAAVILDLGLPDGDGLSILRELRHRKDPTPVLVLTARGGLQDRVTGLRSGADDYLVKPFALEELLARVQALCRRTYGSKQPRLMVGDLEVDTIAREVFRAGQPVKLKPREYLLLEYLVVRAGQVVSRSDIEAHIYNGEVDTMSNAVESAISSLRKKINEHNPAPLIHTRHGLGYVLKAEPK